MARSIHALVSSVILSFALVVSADGSPITCGQAPVTAAKPPLRPLAPSALRSGLAVPSSIDATGSRDASGPLSTWLATVPNGSTIRFKAGGTYRMDKGLKLSKRHDLTFEGNGATLKSNGVASCGRNCSFFYLFGGNTGITIRNFNLVGNSPTPGTYSSTWEQSHGITITASNDIEVSRVRITAVGGDGVYISGWSDGVWVHDSHVISNGRMGIAVTAGRNVTVERTAFDQVGYGAFDIEPNDATGGAADVTFRDNIVGSITMPYPKGFFFGANGAEGSQVQRVTVSGNSITADALNTVVNATRRQEIVFTNNEALVAGHGPVLRFAHVDGLTILGNVQPLCSGSLASVTDSSGVTLP